MAKNLTQLSISYLKSAYLVVAGRNGKLRPTDITVAMSYLPWAVLALAAYAFVSPLMKVATQAKQALEACGRARQRRVRPLEHVVITDFRRDGSTACVQRADRLAS